MSAWRGASDSRQHGSAESLGENVLNLRFKASIRARAERRESRNPGSPSIHGSEGRRSANTARSTDQRGHDDRTSSGGCLTARPYCLIAGPATSQSIGTCIEYGRVCIGFDVGVGFDETRQRELETLRDASRRPLARLRPRRVQLTPRPGALPHVRAPGLVPACPSCLIRGPRIARQRSERGPALKSAMTAKPRPPQPQPNS